MQRQRQSSFVENCSFLFRRLPLQLVLSCTACSCTARALMPSAWQSITLKTVGLCIKARKVWRTPSGHTAVHTIHYYQSFFLSRCSPIHKQLACSITRRVARMERIDTAPKDLHQTRMWVLVNQSSHNRTVY